MKNHEIKFKVSGDKYSIIIGNNILSLLPKKIKLLCPNVKKVAIILDKNVPVVFEKRFKKLLKKYSILILKFSANEKSKSLNTINFYLNKLLEQKFNRSDLIISVGGGITGDTIGFVASIFKRGINIISFYTSYNFF